MGTEHLLLGLIAEHDDTAATLLVSAGAVLEMAREKAGEASGPPRTPGSGAEPVFSARAARALERGLRFASQRRIAAVGPVHLLLGILDVEGRAGQVLRGLGVDVIALRATAEAAANLGTSDGSTKPKPDMASPGITPVPTCPGCGAPLEGALAYRRLKASDADGSTYEIGVAYCGTCSSALGVLPG